MPKGINEDPPKLLSLQGQPDSFAFLLHRMIDRVRQSLELPEILAAAVSEVQAFLGTDRVKIYQFHADGSGEVVAEIIHKQRLPSLLGHNFPAEDIPEEARQLFLQARVRSIVDVTEQRIGFSPLLEESHQVLETSFDHDIRFRRVDPCHVDYLTAMGVQASLVVPILDGDRLWGLLVSHHSQRRLVSERELLVVQLVADQISAAIAQANLLNQVRQQAAQESVVNQVSTLLHTSPEPHLKKALKQTIAALEGSGGRLYTHDEMAQSMQVITVGQQPVIRPEKMTEPTSSPLSQALIEEHPHWQPWLEMEEAIANDLWAIADLYQAVLPSDLAIAFLSIDVRGLLVIRLQYQDKHLGYLSIFRPEIDVERIWAGKIDWSDTRQRRPRQSFETWCELKRGQAQVWTSAEIELAQALGQHFAMAIHQILLYQQIQSLNTSLSQDIQKRQQAEAKITALNAELEQRVLERTAALEEANSQLMQQILERDQALAERQQAEALLENLSRQNELILNFAGEGIYGLSLQGKITFANAAAARILGYTVQELLDQPMHSLLRHSRSDGTLYLLAESPIYATLRDGTVQSVSEDLFWRRNGSSFPVEYVSTPIREQDKITGAVVVFKDITDRQLVEQMKDEFISIVSHELRTPLTSIRSTLGLLASGWLSKQPEKSQRMMEIAFSNTNRLVRLLNDILDIERIKFGKVTLDRKICNAADLMQQSSDGMRAAAEKTGIVLQVVPLEAWILADCDRIIQTFTNLLGNAIKFSSSGSTVSLTAEIFNETHEILFCVKDQGIGIPEDKLETIFDRFQQIDTSNARSKDGTGLGLAICRGIVQQHNGRIWAESILGQGSTFFFTLPLTQME
jgi:PAS domain S-box-containing protein